MNAVNPLPKSFTAKITENNGSFVATITSNATGEVVLNVKESTLERAERYIITWFDLREAEYKYSEIFYPATVLYNCHCDYPNNREFVKLMHESEGKISFSVAILDNDTKEIVYQTPRVSRYEEAQKIYYEEHYQVYQLRS